MHYRALIVLLGATAGSCLKLKTSSDTFTPSHIIPGGVFKDDINGSASHGGELGTGPPGAYDVPYTVPWNNRIDNLNQDFRNGYHPDPRIAPYGGLQNTPYGGLQNTPYGGLQNTPYGGPQNTPYGGLQNTPYSGPQNTPYPQSTPYNGLQNTPYRPEYRDQRYGVSPYQPYSDPRNVNTNNYGVAPYQDPNGYQGYPQQPYQPGQQQPQYNTYPDTNDRGSIDRSWYDRTPYRGYDRLITPQGLYSYPGIDNYRRTPVNYVNPNNRTPRRPYPNQGQFYQPDYPFSNTSPIQFNNN